MHNNSTLSLRLGNVITTASVLSLCLGIMTNDSLKPFNNVSRSY